MKQRTTFLVFAASLMLGGLATMTAIWLLSGLVPPATNAGRVLAVAVIGIAATARDFGIVQFRLPENDRQVPETVFARGPALAALQFGFELGTGVRTKLTTSVPYLTAAAAALLSPPLTAFLMAGLAFGAGRAAILYQRYTSRDEVAWDRSFDRRARWTGRFCSLLALATVLMLALLASE